MALQGLPSLFSRQEKAVQDRHPGTLSKRQAGNKGHCPSAWNIAKYRLPRTEELQKRVLRQASAKARRRHDGRNLLGLEFRRGRHQGPLFGKRPVAQIQYCQFHQMQTARHKLTANPKLRESRELLGLAGLLCHADKESFVGLLNEWHAKREGFLNERTADERGRTFYTHKNPEKC